MGSHRIASYSVLTSVSASSSIKIRMRGLDILTWALMAVVVSSQDGPVYDEYKRIHCSSIFPNTKNYVAGRLNETVNHLEGNYFGIRAGVDAALDTVVAAQAAACLTIEKLIAGVKTTT